MYRIVYTKTFERDIQKLDHQIVKRILRKILEVSKNPQSAQALHYSPRGLSKLYKVRAGDWRILFWMDHGEKMITLYAVAHRSAIYRDLQ